jgi:signal transduction histidine kinase
LDQARPWILDTALAGGLLAASALVASHAEAGPPSALVTVVMVLAALPYCFRRYAPLVVLIVAGVLVVSLIFLGQSTSVIGSALFLAAYTVAAHSDLRATVVAAIFAVLVLGVVVVAAPDRMGWPEAATNVALFVGSFALGRASQSHREAVRLEAERAELAERAQAEIARSASDQERLRIARELHDVVGHSLGAIALQAGVGARVALSDPQEARNSLLSIAERSRASLHEVRQILGALRNPADDLEPTPGLGDLDRLVAHARDADLAVNIIQTGEPWPVSPALSLTLYRLVQESLTNVMRHAEARVATVTIAFAADRLTVTVVDDGRGQQHHASAGTGHVGMRERVMIWGGELHTGTRPAGGYEVIATVPRPEEGRP